MKSLSSFTNLPAILSYVINNKFCFLKSKKLSRNADLDLIYRIQPVSGVKFEDVFWKLGDGYMTCIHIYSTPSEDLTRHWLYELFAMPNVITTIDVRPLKLSDIQEDIKRVVDDSLSVLEKTENVIEMKEAQNKIEAVNDILNEAMRMGNTLLALDLRVFVSGHSFAKCEENRDRIHNTLKDNGFYKNKVNLNEMKEEYLSLFQSPAFIQQTPSGRDGLTCPANVLAMGAPFYQVGWQDTPGYYLGDVLQSADPGTVIFNPFQKDAYRSSYDMFICGEKGTGKSTTIKRLIEQISSTGNKVRVIDVTGEFEAVVRNLGGSVIKFDSNGMNGILNLLEILRMDDSDTQNYLMHISKLSHIYRLLKPDCSHEELEIFKNLLKKLYVEFGIIENISTNNYQNITGLNSNKYPIFSDFLDLIDREIKILSNNNTSENAYILKSVLSIKIVINSIVNNYGSLFDGYTSIPDVVSADVISYDISDIVKLEDKIFDMQLFNVLSMAYDSCMEIGSQMKKLYDEKKINFYDVTRHVIILDECHLSINVNKPFAIKRMLDIMRQDRKFFIGVYLATQNIADMCRNGTDNTTKDITTLFEATQYKMIFRQDANATQYLQQAFNNILTPLQIDEIPILENREAYLVLTPRQIVRFKTKDIDSAKLAYYGGGA